MKDNTVIKKIFYVRTSRPDGPFRKGYASGWSKEIFKVEMIKEFPKDGMKLYYVEDLDKESARWFL